MLMSPIAILASILIVLGVRLRVRLLVSRLVQGVRRSNIVVRYVFRLSSLFSDLVETWLTHHSVKVCQKQAWTRYHKHECKLLKDPKLPPIPSSVRATLQLAFLMDSDTVSEEDKAGVRRLGAHDSTTLGEPKEVMLYEVTVTAATDLYARAGYDPSKIRDYVSPLQPHDSHSAKQEIDPS
jgi:hypothetical protein